MLTISTVCLREVWWWRLVVVLHVRTEEWKVRSVVAGGAHARGARRGRGGEGVAPRPPVSTRVSGAARVQSAASGLFLILRKVSRWWTPGPPFAAYLTHVSAGAGFASPACLSLCRD